MSSLNWKATAPSVAWGAGTGEVGEFCWSNKPQYLIHIWYYRVWTDNVGCECYFSPMEYGNYIHCEVLSHPLPLDPGGRKYPMPSNAWENADPSCPSLIHWRLTKLKNIIFCIEADAHQMAINFNNNKGNYNESMPCNSVEFST